MTIRPAPSQRRSSSLGTSRGSGCSTPCHRDELCVCDLATLLTVSQSAVSHQLRLLRGMRLVRARRSGRMVFYSLDDRHIHTPLSAGFATRARECPGGDHPSHGSGRAPALRPRCHVPPLLPLPQPVRSARSTPSRSSRPRGWTVTKKWQFLSDGCGACRGWKICQPTSSRSTCR